jgi:hypothetical protein
MKTLKTLTFVAFLIFGSALFSVNVWASCNASTLVTTPDSSSVQTCLNAATSGATVTISSGSATWTTDVSTSTPVILQGATTCTGSGDPYGSTSGIVTCTDNTTITLASSAGELNLTGCPSQITGITFIQTYENTNGAIELSGTHGNQCFRFNGNHIESSYEITLTAASTYGLVDHNLIQDTTTSGIAPLMMLFWGDLASNGYQNWIDTTNLGTNQAVYMEQNEFTSGNTGSGGTPYGAYDGHDGTKFVFRFNTLNGIPAGLTHGTDSGDARSVVLNEMYANAFSNSPASYPGIFSTRGGQLLFWGNTVAGSTWQSIYLNYYRYLYFGDTSGAPNECTSWGCAHPGLNYTPLLTDITNINATENTLNASDWTASHSYAANAYIGPTSNNAGAFNYQTTASCTSSGTRPSFNQTVGGTTTDNTCTWTNVGGSTAASPAQGTAAGFCAANLDTACSANSTCSALQSGDTCSAYFDTNGGVYPYRDQPGRTHNQMLNPNYEWLNTGANIPSPLFTPNPNPPVAPNRDYYDYESDFTGASGTGSGTLAARPSTCTTGVAYWATDQGSWNSSGNGFGSGVLYQCSATNTWTAYYTPYTYPYSSVSAGPAPPTGLSATVN